jgi:uncharacterized 2Fe-2S/4Fe-4S cluster protein (DUF4445 family)
MGADEPTLPTKKIVLDLDLEQLGTVPCDPATVTLLPSGRRVRLEAGESIFEAARRSGVAVPSTCGGKGTCGRCRVQLPLPARPPTYVERQFIDRADLARGVRLACRSRPVEDLTATVLPEQQQRRR